MQIINSLAHRSFFLELQITNSFAKVSLAVSDDSNILDFATFGEMRSNLLFRNSKGHVSYENGCFEIVLILNHEVAVFISAFEKSVNTECFF
jgi:hypothetical protein